MRKLLRKLEVWAFWQVYSGKVIYYGVALQLLFWVIVVTVVSSLHYKVLVKYGHND